MMNRAVHSDKADIVRLLTKKILNNVYMYIDIVTYGLDNDFIKVWIRREDGAIRQIILKYYNSFQIYADEEDYTGTLELILEHRPAMISGEAHTIERLYREVSELYTEKYGVVLTQPYVESSARAPKPELAVREDMEEIALLVCTDEGIGGHYDFNELKDQFTRRYDDQTGRNWVIRENRRIVAHYATYAEAPGIAVMGGLIVSPKYRGRGYARSLHSFLANTLIKENKKPVLFCHDTDVLGMYLKLGANISSHYGKLTLVE